MTDEQWEIVNELRMLALGHGGPCCAKAANEIERLALELANANRLLEIGRRRSLEKSGGLEIVNNTQDVT